MPGSRLVLHVPLIFMWNKEYSKSYPHRFGKCSDTGNLVLLRLVHVSIGACDTTWNATMPHAISITGDVIMDTMASQITSRTIVYPTVYSGADQRKHQSSALLAFVWGIPRWPVNSPHKRPVTRKVFPFDDVIMNTNTALSGAVVIILISMR